MWFAKKQQNEETQMPDVKHPTYEQIEARHPWVAETDVTNEGPDTLSALAEECQAPTYDPDNCLACLAHVTLVERYKNHDVLYGYDETDLREQVAQEAEGALADDPPARPGMAYVPERGDWVERPEHAQENRHQDPMAEVLRTIEYLRPLLDEALNGPPIPPREVSEVELALLVVAAQRWIKITEAQGVDLAPQQQQMLNATKELVERLNRG